MNYITLFFNNHIFRAYTVFIGCVSLLAFGFILQYIVGLTPCPLCILQRFFFAWVGCISLGIAIKSIPKEHLLLASVFSFLFSVAGGALAARQIWLQHNPPSLLGSNCAPWLGSITNLIESVFNASADCAERGWTLLSLSIPEWSLIAFIALALVSTIPFWKK